jgi:hypothetical protein
MEHFPSSSCGSSQFLKRQSNIHLAITPYTDKYRKFQTLICQLLKTQNFSASKAFRIDRMAWLFFFLNGILPFFLLIQAFFLR